MNLLLEWYRDSPLWTATWVDWLDIGILSFLIYRVLLVVRGTRALKTLVALLVLAIIFVISDLLGMSTVHWILESLFVYAVLGVLILFQDDIRHALASAGGSWFGRGVNVSDAHVIEEVVQACFALAHRKVGALIALERSASLLPFTEGAQRLDARVSTELLQSIFHPSSPLHDGAVVISSQRVTAAGVFLPLSLTKNLSRAYGTRHRAAVGLADATDALVVVVSEERGTVALVMGGELTPIADANDLRERLLEHLSTPGPKPAEDAA